MPKTSYKKPHLPYEEQIKLLKKRGLSIPDESRALHLLKYISYYRLSGYWYPMLKNPKSSHVFEDGSNFETAFKYYCFDSQLRKLVISELEKIEISFRAKMIYILSESYGPFWYMDSTIFKSEEKLNVYLDKLRDEYSRSDEEFLRHFSTNYSDTLPPSWMIFEITSFGLLSNFYKNLKGIPEKRSLAEHFGIKTRVLESWLHHIVYVRNLCAHHSRFWNRYFRIIPKLPKNVDNLWLEKFESKSTKINKKVYFTLSMIIYFLNIINPEHTFVKKLRNLFNKYPMVNLKNMGFHDKWQSEILWSNA